MQMMASASSTLAIGIDLGTTFSCVAVLTRDRVEVIKNDRGKSTMPSYVAYDGNRRLVGERARKHAVIDPQNTVNNMKRLIGRTLNDAKVKEDIRTFPFKVIGDSSANPRVQVKFEGKDKLFSPEEISAVVLGELKTMAEEFLGTQVKDAVITVPAYFTNNQKKATMDAGRIAGLNILATINEPTAAALAYGFDNPDEAESKTVIVFDFGGGTFDVSVLNVRNGEVNVLSSDGHGHLGGEDIDELLLKYFSKEFLQKNEIDLFNKARSSDDNVADNAKRALRRLGFACEKAKIKLSSERNAKVDLPLLFDGKDLDKNITRQFFDSLCEELIRETLSITIRTIEAANLTPEDISEIILVGGSTRIPLVIDSLKDIFPHKEPFKNINPDEAVAYGAAIKAAIMSGVDPATVRNIRLRDVVPMSLGIESYGGLMATFIKRNTPIPCEKRKIFSTNKDNQTQVCVKVFEGERHITKLNSLLGEFLLVGIPPAPRGVPQIECLFHVDTSGILRVKTTDLSTECVSDIKITNNQGRLNPIEMDRAVREAERMKQQDLQFRKNVKAMEKLEVYAQQIDKALQNSKLRDKMDAEQLRIITIKVKEALALSQSYKEPNECDYQEKYNELEKLWLPGVMKLFNQKQDNIDAPVLEVDDSLS